MIDNQWMLACVVLPGGTISQIVDESFSPGLQEIIEGGSGTLDPEFIAIGEGKPMLSFTSTALATALGIAGLGAYAITSAADWYFQRIEQGGTRSAGAVHKKLTTTKGILVPRSIRASQGVQPATISYDLLPLSADGETAPVAITSNQSLPTIPLVSELFTLGPVSINGAFMSGGQSMNWDFNMAEERHADDGGVWPTFAGIATRTPVCAVNGFDMNALSTHGLSGLALTSFKTYFRKIAAGSTRVASGTAQHVRLQGTGGMLLPRSASGDYKKPLVGEWNICPKWDGTTDVVAISTAAAITV
jgi:hypothetical protein